MNYKNVIIVGQVDTECGSRKEIRKWQKKKFPENPWKRICGCGLSVWARTSNSHPGVLLYRCEHQTNICSRKWAFIDLGQKKESLVSLFHLIVCLSEGQMSFQGLDVQK